MAHTWKYAFGLGLIGAALTASCVVKNGDDDVAGAGGDSGGTGGSTGGSGGTTGGSGGSSAKAGTGGSAAGKGGSSGSAGASAGKGGSTTGGTGGTTDGGMAGADTGGTSGTGGSTSGTGGTVDTSPTCDPATGSTPYPSCAPATGMEKDPCALCVQTHCCDASNNCYATDPYNVCGWGGPTRGDYAGAGEIGCYTICLSEYVTANDVCDADGIDACTAMCTTEMCGLVGDATSELAGCMQESCPSECFGADTCG